MEMTASQLELWKTSPARFIEAAIKDYVNRNPENRLKSFPGERIWDEPLVGFADGDDALFQEYKKIIGDFHVTPREALQIHAGNAGVGGQTAFASVSVISWVLPSTGATRLSMRQETLVPSLRWNHTRWEGQELNFALERHLAALLEGMGYQAVAPDLEKYWETKNLPDGPASNWSQRHIAYAAGLGTFGLSDGFITEKGIAIRLGSVVCNVAMPMTPRKFLSHKENCLQHRTGSCGRCIRRCPAGAISPQGHDKLRCRAFMNIDQPKILKRLGREEGYYGKYLGCGLCQTGVPCESGVPPLTAADKTG